MTDRISRMMSHSCPVFLDARRRRFFAPPLSRLAVLAVLFSLSTALLVSTGEAKEAHWIWSPAHKKSAAPAGTCYFRKMFLLNRPAEDAQVMITCDDQYKLYVNGRLVGSGTDWRALDEYNIGPLLIRGRNVIAVEAKNESPGEAGLVARVVVKREGDTHVSFNTDDSWKTSLRAPARWTMPTFNERGWLSAQSFGEFGKTLPWGNETQMANEKGRFRAPPEFEVEWVLDPDRTGSLIAMTFNEFGQMILSREGGPLLLARDRNGDGIHETLATYCDQVKNCQGLLAINGSVLAVGDGPDGAAFYRLTDKDQDGRVDEVKIIFKFEGGMGEHGPHAVLLGPDGMIYVLSGNHSSVERELPSASPHHDSYEGDLVQPRYEDPRGHAKGRKVPAGAVYRTDVEGSFVELYAGGFRNSYDMAFNRRGDLFAYDADMEWDIGLPWYRPTRINHVTPGAEFGWRSGWAKWPDYYLDSLPSVVDIGPGSPTGVVFYDHIMFPVRYHGAMFACDWALGQINVVTMKQKGGSYEAEAKVFVQGRPLNVTDIEVGPDGWLYFCTGGRGTAGGVYRVVWKGKVPEQIRNLGQGIERALRLPQLNSAWSRQQLAAVKSQLGNEWGRGLYRVVQQKNARSADRIRALDLLQLFGPAPSSELCASLVHDVDPLVRAKAAYVMGLQQDDQSTQSLLTMLADDDATVRRKAVESLVRRGHPLKYESLAPLLGDQDRYVSYAARRALERVPVDSWRETVLTTNETRVFLQGAVALMIAHPSRENAESVLRRCQQWLAGEVQDPAFPVKFISDPNFRDLLRVTQVALVRGQLKPEDEPQLGEMLATEYPSKDATLNRELIRILAFFEQQSVASRIMGQMRSDIPWVEKMFLAAHASHFVEGFVTAERLETLKFYESVRSRKGGASLAGYVDNVSRDFFKHLTESERNEVLAEGQQWPSSALAVLAGLPERPSSETLALVRRLDQRIEKLEGDAVDRLRVGVVAVLARSGDGTSMAYLRQLYEKFPDRRLTIAVGLAQQPSGENWALLIESLPLLEGSAGRMVLTQLAKVDQVPEKPEALRQVILAGLRDKNNASAAATLLSRWMGENPTVSVGKAENEKDAAGKPLAAWQEWFEEHHPDSPAPRLPVDSEKSRWTFAELRSFLEQPDGRGGDLHRGAEVFKTAQCSKCHRYGDVGDRTGPDLSNVSRRFQRKEILESILFPSQVISDQYQAHKIQTVDGQMVHGIVSPLGSDRVVVLQQDGDKVELLKSDIEEEAPSRTSAMPEGALDKLTLQQIADLFAYLDNPPRENVTSRLTPEKEKQ